MRNFLSGLVLVVMAGVVVAGCTSYQQPVAVASPAPSPMSSPQPPTKVVAKSANPKNVQISVVQDFYNRYLMCLGKYFQTNTSQQSYEFCKLSSDPAVDPKSELVNRLTSKKMGGADQVICAQNLPKEIDIQSYQPLSRISGIVWVRAVYSDATGVLTVQVEQTANGWQIEDIRCR